MGNRKGLWYVLGLLLWVVVQKAKHVAKRSLLPFIRLSNWILEGVIRWMKKK